MQAQSLGMEDWKMTKKILTVLSLLCTLPACSSFPFTTGERFCIGNGICRQYAGVDPQNPSWVRFTVGNTDLYEIYTRDTLCLVYDGLLGYNPPRLAELSVMGDPAACAEEGYVTTPHGAALQWVVHIE